MAYLTRRGAGYIPYPDDLLQEHDVIHMLVATGKINDIQRVLAVRPKVQADGCGSSSPGRQRGSFDRA